MFDYPQLAALSQALRSGRAHDLYRSIERMADTAIGFQMLTVMRYNAATSELARVHSNHPNDYPIGGSKVKEPSPWKQALLIDCQPVLSNTPESVRAHFDDHRRLAGLGIEAILNIPIVRRGQCIGTLNLGHRAGWFSDAHIDAGIVLAALLVCAFDD